MVKVYAMELHASVMRDGKVPTVLNFTATMLMTVLGLGHVLDQINVNVVVDGRYIL